MKINHLGIATKGIEESLKFWSDALGLENVHTEVVEDQKVRVAMLPLGESRIELLEPTSDDSPISILAVGRRSWLEIEVRGRARFQVPVAARVGGVRSL